MASLAGSLSAARRLALSIPAHWLIIGAGAALRVFGLGRWPLWYDEASTALFARLPFGQMLAATAGDVHPPLYYSVQWVVMRLLGESELALRLPSVVFSVWALWMVWRVAHELRWPRAATLVALGFMALSSAQIYYAQEARMYALFTALVWAGLLFVVQRRYALFAFSGAALMYTHNYGLFYFGVLALVGVWNEMQRPAHWAPSHLTPQWPDKSEESRLAEVVAYSLSAMLFYAPWVLALTGQMRQVASGYWIQPVTVGAVVDALQSQFFHSSPPTVIASLITLVTVGAVAYTLWRMRHGRDNSTLALAAVAMLPLMLAVGLSLAWKPLLLPRALLPSGPAWYLLIGWAVMSLPKMKRLYAAVLIAPVTIGALVGVYLMMPMKGITPQMVQYVRDRWQPGDVIVYTGDGPFITWGWYARDLPQLMVERCAPSIGGMSDQTIAALGVDRRPLSETPYRRAWFVYILQPTQPLCQDEIADALVQGAREMRVIADNEYVRQIIYLKPLP